VRLLVHAQTIVSELSRSLDIQRGGEIAKNLWQLYEYVQFVINQSVIKRSDEGLAPACKVVAELLVAWKQITGQNTTGHAAPYADAEAVPPPPAPPNSNPVYGYDIQSGALKAILVA
jgi:hypothetical protein